MMGRLSFTSTRRHFEGITETFFYLLKTAYRITTVSSPPY